MLDTQQKNRSNLENISSTLTSLRKEKNITVDSISQQTRIKPEYLLKLEQNDFKFLPAPYVYAMLKVYGQYLQVDENMLKNCREELDILTDEALHDLVKSNQNQNGHPSFDISHMTLKQWGLYGGIAFGLVFLIGLILFIFNGSGDGPTVVVKTTEPQPVAVASPPSTTSKQPEVVNQNGSDAAKTVASSADKKTSEAKTTSPKTTTPAVQSASVAPTTSAVSANPGTSKQLTIKALSDTSWVKVISGDGSVTSEALLLPNQERQYTAKGGFELTVGRAQAVNITLNGQPVTKPRPRGWIKFNVGK